MRAAVLLTLTALASTPAQAACRLALVLALDVSASVDWVEDRFQRQGLARVLMLPEIQRAFLAVPGRPVTLAAFEWSGRFQQEMLLHWQEINGPGDLAAAAAAIGNKPRGRSDMPTALGNALGFAAGLFTHGPDCERRKIDVSGDGRNNDGFPPASAYREFPFEGITVNGLSIGGSDPMIGDYYRQVLIRGPGAFVIEADDFADFERAMRLKLLRELEGPVIGMLDRNRR